MNRVLHTHISYINHIIKVKKTVKLKPSPEKVINFIVVIYLITESIMRV